MDDHAPDRAPAPPGRKAEPIGDLNRGPAFERRSVERPVREKADRSTIGCEERDLSRPRCPREASSRRPERARTNSPPAGGLTASTRPSGERAGAPPRSSSGVPLASRSRIAGSERGFPSRSGAAPAPPGRSRMSRGPQPPEPAPAPRSCPARSAGRRDTFPFLQAQPNVADVALALPRVLSQAPSQEILSRRNRARQDCPTGLAFEDLGESPAASSL